MTCSVRYRSHGFTGSSPVPPNAGSLSTSWEELVYSAITVGRASLAHLTRFGRYSHFEMAYRANLLFANLKSATTGHLEKTEVYEGLDPSEKSAVSYWLGLMAAKLFAARFLETDFLCHLDVYRNFPDPRYKIEPTFFAGGKKPDLVGLMRTGGWIAIEAKGRTNNFRSYVIASAKTEQLANLLAINSIPPRLKVAVHSFFTGGELRVHLEDPDYINEAAQNLKLPDKAVFLRHWYEPFLKLVDQQHQTRREGDDQFRIAELVELDMKIGIDSVLYRYLTDTGHPETILDLIATKQDRKGERWYMGKEGIFVELGRLWSQDNMSLEPFMRISSED